MRCRNLFLAVVLFLVGQFVVAQSVVGTWKRTNSIVNDAKGNAKDVQQDLEKSMPCATKITYSFLSTGIQKTNIPNDTDCKKRMSSMASLYADAKYEFSGSKITIYSPKNVGLPDANYEVSFSGNTMTWTFDYVRNPKMPNPTKARSMKIVYQKL